MLVVFPCTKCLVSYWWIWSFTFSTLGFFGIAWGWKVPSFFDHMRHECRDYLLLGNSLIFYYLLLYYLLLIHISLIIVSCLVYWVRFITVVKPSKVSDMTPACREMIPWNHLHIWPEFAKYYTALWLGKIRVQIHSAWLKAGIWISSNCFLPWILICFSYWKTQFHLA